QQAGYRAGRLRDQGGIRLTRGRGALARYHSAIRRQTEHHAVRLSDAAGTVARFGHVERNLIDQLEIELRRVLGKDQRVAYVDLGESRANPRGAVAGEVVDLAQLDRGLGNVRVERRLVLPLHGGVHGEVLAAARVFDQAAAHAQAPDVRLEGGVAG